MQLQTKMKTFDVPVSFHIFNRPEVTARVFKIIKTIRPKYLFVTADGPREKHTQDQANCHKVRNIVDNNIDWDCELYKNYSDINKGSYKSTSEGITWVFNNVEEAIILEDDCLPSLSFFRFCKELLDYYRDDKRISIISGNNFQKNMKDYPHSYYFSSYTHNWGWATWRRTWEQVDLQMNNWTEFRDSGCLKTVFSDISAQYYWEQIFQKMSEPNSRQHWDYKLFLSSIMNNSLNILPNINLVSNIGFGENATNCKKNSWVSNLPTFDMNFPLKHPPSIYQLYWADKFTERHQFSKGIPPLIRKTFKLIKKYKP